MGRFLIFLIVALALAIALAGCAAGSKEKLVIAVQPTATPEQLTAQASELEKFLESRLSNVDVEIRFPTTFSGVVEALRFGHAQAAFMSAWPASLAAKYAGAEVALAEVREVVIDDKKTEAPYYYSYWVVLKNSPYASLNELKGKKVAFPSPLSTSGYVAPLAKLVELGLVPGSAKEADPKAFFGQVTFAGGYAQGWEALKQGQVDVTVIAGDVSETLYREVLDNTKILQKQGPIPSHGVVFSKDLKDPLRSNLRDALMELGKPERKDLMRKFVSGIFVSFKPTNTQEHLGPLAQYLETTKLAFTETLK